MSTIIIRYKRKKYEADDEKEEFRSTVWEKVTEVFASDNYNLEMNDDRCGYFYAGEAGPIKRRRISGKDIMDLIIDGRTLIGAGKTVWTDRKEIGVRDEDDEAGEVEV